MFSELNENYSPSAAALSAAQQISFNLFTSITIVLISTHVY